MGTEERTMTEESRRTFVVDYLRKARNLHADAERRHKDKRYADVISAVQESLEFVIKALLIAARVEPPKTHQLHDRKFRPELTKLAENIKGDLDADAWQKLDLPRLLFLASFWSEFYLQAKYGSEVLGTGPYGLFREAEAALALAHLREAIGRLLEVYGHPSQ